MKTLTGAARAFALAMGLLLAGCGGGGGTNSTPTPLPSPTPSPTPTPTAVNDDLIAPLVSESFANRAATATLTPSGGSQAPASLTVSYDAPSDSYTVSVPGRSQTFRPTDLSSPGNYRRTSASAIDDLTLAPTGPSVGSVYRYVGAGFWQRQNLGAGGVTSASFDGFVYGVPTATLVRTGKSFYRTDALGVMLNFGELLAFNGAGMLEANFASGAVMAQGNLQLIDPVTGEGRGQYNYVAPLTIAASGNALNGGMTIGGTSTGSIHGQFFGPNAEEVGLAFSTSDPGGNLAVGTLRGRTSLELDLGPLKTLPGTKTFDVSYYGQPLGAGLTIDPIAKTYAFNPRSGSPLSSTPQSHRVNISGFSLGSADKAAVQSSTKFTEYNSVVDGRTMKVLFYNYGSDNSEIQLSYGSFYKMEVGPNVAGTSPEFARYTLYGQTTPPSFMPTSGSATYRGPIYGVAEYSDGIHYNVTGQSTFNINFGAANSSGTLDMLLTSVRGGSDMTLTRTVNTGSPFISGGYALTQFFGPNAEELGVSFGFIVDFLAVSGVSVAKKQ